MERARRRPGSDEAYEELEAEYALTHELLAARTRAGMTQEQVAERMGTTKSAVSRLEAGRSHSPSVSTLERYARAVGCEVEIRLTPVSRARAVTSSATRSGG
jgi:transcriptional regulator with XRE-family HTH domain